MRLKIYFENEQDKHRVSTYLERLLRKAIRTTLLSEGIEYPVEISLTFTDNAGIRTLNRDYRKTDRATDVLSFPQYDFAGGEAPLLIPGEAVALGDIVLSLERAAEQASTFGHSFSRETAFLTVHSVLHLLGYDHELGEEEELLMREKQRAVMKQIGLDLADPSQKGEKDHAL